MAMVSVEKGDSQVSHVAKNLPKCQCTTIEHSFLRHRRDSWQVHLQRISPFLVSGEGVWWRNVDGSFQFLDGDDDRDTNDRDDFTLMHFREHSVTNVEERSKQCWKRIISERLLIPATDVKVFDDGTCIGRIDYANGNTRFTALGMSAGDEGIGESASEERGASVMGVSAVGGGGASSVSSVGIGGISSVSGVGGGEASVSGVGEGGTSVSAVGGGDKCFCCGGKRDIRCFC